MESIFLNSSSQLTSSTVFQAEVLYFSKEGGACVLGSGLWNFGDALSALVFDHRIVVPSHVLVTH